MASGNAAALFGTLKRVLGQNAAVSEDILDKNGVPITDKTERQASLDWLLRNAAQSARSGDSRRGIGSHSSHTTTNNRKYQH